MIAGTHKSNGHAAGKTALDVIDRIIELDEAYRQRRQDREAASTYTAGTCDRMNPMPKGIDPLGTDAQAGRWPASIHRHQVDGAPFR